LERVQFLRSCSGIHVDEGRRYFALPAGYGSAALDRAKLEVDFGLRVTANIVESGGLSGLQSRTLGVVTQQKDVSTNNPGEVWELGVDLDREVIRSLSGVPVDQEFARRLHGSDSLAVHRELTVNQLAPFCLELFRQHRDVAYRDKFPFIDHVRAVKGPTQIAALDAALNDKLANRSTEGVSIFLPMNEASSGYELSCERGSTQVFGASLDEVYVAMDRFALAGPDSVRSVHISPLDESGQAVDPRPLYEYLTFEGVVSGESYVFSAGRWYKVNPSFLGRVADRLQQIEIVDLQHILPNMEDQENEGAYNARVANNPELCLFDRENFRQGLPAHSQIEVCDLLHRDGTFICIKKYRGSKELSHLFSQASVSARLFAEHEPYRQFTADAIGDRWPIPFDIREPHRPSLRFVLVIVCEPGRTVPDGLPFFSRANLLFHAREITRLGFRFGLARIVQDPAPQNQPAARRRRRVAA